MIKIIIVNLIMLFALCGQVFAVTGNNYNTSLSNRYLGYETAKKIYENSWVDKGATEAQIKSITDQFNLWFEQQEENINLRNICFFFASGTYDKKLYWFVSNGSYSSTLPYAYLTNVWESTTASGAYIKSFKNWTYDTEGAINGATTGTIATYRAGTTSVEDLTSSNFQIQMNGEISGDDLNIYITDRIQAPLSTFEIYGYNNNRGYGVYFLKNTFKLVTNPAAEPTPTPTPTPEPTKTPTSGDYGPVIDDINNNLNNIQNTIISGNQEILNNMLNSGDLGIVLGETKLSGDEWVEEESSGFLGGLIKGIWGVFNKIWKALFEVDNEKVTTLINNFNTVLEANSNLLGLPLYLITSTMNTFIEYEPQDFILSWNAINYQGINIVPGGQINFNEFINNNAKFKEIYDIMILIESIGFIFLFASWMRNMFLDLLGINWLGLASEEPEVETTYAMDTIVDHDTGEIVSEINTKTTRNHKTGETHRIKDVWRNNIYKRGRK